MIETTPKISMFLRTCVSPPPGRDAVSSLPGWFALRSHPGLVRTSNDDRVLLAHWTDRMGPCWVVAIADGVGSGKAGAEAAALALASLVAALVDISPRTEQGLASAAEFANRTVFDRWRGNEGATLSAVMVRADDAALVNVGDSRIYGIDREDNLVLLTKDDTHPKIPGLLQFIGMGRDLVPHVQRMAERYTRVLLTSDGTHASVGPLFPQLIHAAKTDMSLCAERLILTAIWCGGGDNATVALAELQGGPAHFELSQCMNVWTPGTHHYLSGDLAPSQTSHTPPRVTTGLKVPKRIEARRSGLKPQLPLPEGDVQRSAKSDSASSKHLIIQSGADDRQTPAEPSGQHNVDLPEQAQISQSTGTNDDKQSIPPNDEPASLTTSASEAAKEARDTSVAVQDEAGSTEPVASKGNAR